VAIDSLDPVQFCSAQIQALRASIDAQSQALRTSIDALSRQVELLGNAIDDMRASRVEDAEEGAVAALARITHDSDHGRPYWERGADHIGRRWYDVWSRWLGGWLTKLVGGAALTAAVIWYVTSNGGKK
jgi:hypothetical protein